MTHKNRVFLGLFFALGCSTKTPELIGPSPTITGDAAVDSAVATDGTVIPGVDLGSSDLTSSSGLTFHEKCFPNFPAPPPGQATPHYDQFNPIIGSHCQGTNQQDIKNVQKVVFIGDSVTAGTPPTSPDQFYRNQLTAQLKTKFGADLEVGDCSAWGAQTDDLSLPPHEQIHTCFPSSEPKTTLVIMTIGGNDANHWAGKSADGSSDAVIHAGIDTSVQQMRDAVSWFRSDPTRFPNGVYIIFANVYEFTDGTGDVASCPGALATGVKTPGLNYPAEFVRLNEQFLKIAVDTQTDMIFLLEQFCGHGYHRDDANGYCYRGPNTEMYFDLTCIHPTPVGHTRLADMFMAVVNE